MKFILKIFKFLAITLAVILLVLVILSLVIREHITPVFTAEVNKFTKTEISVEDLGFSLLRGFPRATVEFKNLSLESPAPDDPWLDSLLTDRMLLEAGTVYAAFNIRDILRKEYSIERISLKNSSLAIFKDDKGISLNRILKQGTRSDSSRISFDLEEISLENTGIRYFSSPGHFLIDLTLENARGKVSYHDNKTGIKIKSAFKLGGISSKDRPIIQTLENASIDGELLINEDSIHFKQIHLTALNQALDIEGSLLRKERWLDMNVGADEVQMRELLSIVVTENKVRQDIVFSRLDAGFSLDVDRAAESFIARASSFSAEYAGSEYHGSALLKNLNSSYVDLRIHSSVDLASLFNKYQGEELESLKGSMHLNMLLRGRTGRLKDITRDDIFKLERRINLHFSDAYLKTKSFDKALEHISGNIMLADKAWADELSFSLSGQNLVMNCMIGNPEGLLGRNNNTIDIKAGIWADKLDKNILITKRNIQEAKPAPGTRQHPAPLFDRVNASLSLTADSLIIDDFQCSQFNGLLHYRPGLINISSFSLLALDGALSGNAALIENAGGSYMARGWFDLGAIDIHRAFRVFNNFSQDKIIADNIEGDISGSVSISTQLDTSFKLLPSSLSVTGNYTIYNGALLDFEPALKLSRFIELKELEKIRFSDLHNDLVISDSRVLIPSMEINSSAFNISLSGEQDFSGNFEYHLSILLSEILSKRAKSSDSYISEFGRVEDDGLGRTTLFLKLEKGEEGTKVSYDVKKLSEEIKESLKEEKQELKTILNEEYGWYKADSLQSNPENSSRRFRITWEEADSVKTVEPERTIERRGILKKLFKPDTTKKKL